MISRATHNRERILFKKNWIVNSMLWKERYTRWETALKVSLYKTSQITTIIRELTHILITEGICRLRLTNRGELMKRAEWIRKDGLKKSKMKPRPWSSQCLKAQPYLKSLLNYKTLKSETMILFKNPVWMKKGKQNSDNANKFFKKHRLNIRS